MINKMERVAAHAMNEARARHAFDRTMVGRQFSKEETDNAWAWFITGYRACELHSFTATDERDSLVEKLQCAGTLRDALKEFLA